MEILLQNHLLSKGYITDAWNIQLRLIIQHYMLKIYGIYVKHVYWPMEFCLTVTYTDSYKVVICSQIWYHRLKLLLRLYMTLYN